MKKLAPLLFLLLLLGCGSTDEIQESTPQIISLKNEYLHVKAKRTGAELISIKLLEDNTEYLWQGDSITWSDHAIVQFPIIGNLKNGEYKSNGDMYKLMSHGFARVSDFNIIEQSDSKLIYALKSNAETKKLYPFEFTFIVSYILEGKSIQVNFEVVNEGSEEMNFSLGYHPGFNCPLKIGESMEDYYLEFSENETVNRLILKNDLIDSVQNHYLFKTNKIHLSKDIFKDDAIILEEIASTRLHLRNKLNDKSVTLDFGDIPYLGIWSPKQFGDFVCIEPWYGIPDLKNATGNLADKPGSITLPKRDSYNWECIISIN